MRQNFFIGIFFLWCIAYSYINQSVFKSTLVHLEYIGFLAILINIFITIKGYDHRSVKIANSVVLVLLWAVFAIFPSYTYEEALEILSTVDNNYVIVDYNDNENYKVGAPQIYQVKIDGLIVKGNYLVYIANREKNDLKCYKVNPIDGSYSVYYETTY